MNKCLVCFAPLDSGSPSAYHKRCAKALFESTTEPAIDLDLNALAEAGLSLLRASGAVPGVGIDVTSMKHYVPTNNGGMTAKTMVSCKMLDNACEMM